MKVGFNDRALKSVGQMEMELKYQNAKEIQEFYFSLDQLFFMRPREW